jgi:peptide/nickel transport system ATP-binding protein
MSDHHTGARPTPPTAGPVLEVTDLDVEFAVPEGTIKAVDGLSYSLAAGEVLAIIGESGSGKSVGAETLLGLLRGMTGFTARGSVRLRGRELMSASAREIAEIRGRDISLVFQDPSAALNPALTIGYQMSEVFRIRRGASRAEARRLSIEMLTAVGLPRPAERMDDYPHQLSGGMRQRVMIGIALSLQPAVLIADEATTALDVTIQAEILRLLNRLRDTMDMAILLISHDLGVAREVADRIGVMYAGRLVEIGSPDAIFAAPKHPYTRALLASTPTLARRAARFVPIDGAPPDPLEAVVGCPFLPRCSSALDVCATARPAFAEIEPGRWIACHLPGGVTAAAGDVAAPGPPRRNGSGAVGAPAPGPRAVAPDAPVLLAAHDLRREFAGSAASLRQRARVVAVDGVTLELGAEETLAIVGESGSGKSTVARMVARLLEPTAGQVLYRGTDLWALKGRGLRELRKRIQVVFQDPFSSLDPHLTVGQTIRESWIVNRFPYSRKEQQMRIDALLADVGLRGRDASRRPHDFSGGQRQRIAIARALATSPEIVVCDEPVSALDVSVQAQILNLLRRLQETHKMSYLFISHDLAVVRHVAHRVAVMQAGRIVEHGDVESVYRSPRHEYTQRLLAAIPGQDATRRVLATQAP